MPLKESNEHLKSLSQHSTWNLDLAWTYEALTYLKGLSDFCVLPIDADLAKLGRQTVIRQYRTKNIDNSQNLWSFFRSRNRALRTSVELCIEFTLLQKSSLQRPNLYSRRHLIRDIEIYNRVMTNLNESKFLDSSLLNFARDILLRFPPTLWRYDTLIHGDIHPANILVTKLEHKKPCFYLIDFENVSMGSAFNDLMNLALLHKERSNYLRKGINEIQKHIGRSIQIEDLTKNLCTFIHNWIWDPNPSSHQLYRRGAKLILEIIDLDC